MTEERMKYLANISKEERVIRQYILAYKKKIKIFKHYMNDDKEDTDYIRDARCEIAKRKTIIKALKKQLPAPKEKIDLIRGRYYMFLCPACGASVDGIYCFSCGQKLR